MIYHLRWFMALLLPVSIAALAQEGGVQTPAPSGDVRAKTESEIPGASPRGSPGTSGVPGLEAKIDGQVLALSTESLAESLAKLDRQDMYNWPGDRLSGGDDIELEFPLRKHAGHSRAPVQQSALPEGV